MWKSAEIRDTMGTLQLPFPFCGSNIDNQEVVPSMRLAHYARLTKVLMILFAIAFVFVSLASAEGKEKVLYSFQGGTSDGEYPAGGVVFDKAGNLYGATTDGGGECPPAQCGTVFQLAPPAHEGDPWAETVLYIFKGNGSRDGIPFSDLSPLGPVVLSASALALLPPAKIERVRESRATTTLAGIC